MSLYIFEEKRVRTIYKSIHHLLKNGEIIIQNWEKRFEESACKNKALFYRIMSYNFVKRLSLYNQLAVVNYYELREQKDREIVLSVLKADLRIGLLDKKELIRELGMLEYNSIDNNGYNYVGVDDWNTMEEIKKQLQEESEKQV